MTKNCTCIFMQMTNKVCEWISAILNSIYLALVCLRLFYKYNCVQESNEPENGNELHFTGWRNSTATI